MPPIKCMAVNFMKAIEVWLSELTEEALVRPELQESLEPEAVVIDPVLDQSAAASVSQKSDVPPVVLNPGNNLGKSDWTSASDEWAMSYASEEGHMSYNCPTGPTRGRGGGGSTRPCYKCNQDGHFPYNCPNPSTGGRGTKNSSASTQDSNTISWSQVARNVTSS